MRSFSPWEFWEYGSCQCPVLPKVPFTRTEVWRILKMLSLLSRDAFFYYSGASAVGVCGSFHEFCERGTTILRCSESALYSPANAVRCASVQRVYKINFGAD